MLTKFVRERVESPPCVAMFSSATNFERSTVCLLYTLPYANPVRFLTSSSCVCVPSPRFVVPIAFQQTNRPVPVVYSLSTEFHLMNNEKVFLMNPNDAAMSLQEMDFKGAFSKGSPSRHTPCSDTLFSH